ncbi:MAG TPA: class I mannose-6-phosphate isomerase [Symbiobacteriaceae bacterium]|nr:class I mannose-6-phosphate isomerase [Symbiobacteriaceae bacterium]
MSFHTRPANMASAAGFTTTSLSALPLQGLVAVDGMWGVDWEPIVSALAAAGGSPFTLIRTTDFLQAPADLRAHFRPWLTENPVFGHVCTRPLSDYFDVLALERAVAEARASGGAVVVVGPFALGVGTPDLRLYCDLPREEIIRRQAAATYRNLGDDRTVSSGAKYKDAYYVEWPLLEAHKRQVLAGVDYYVDCSNASQPVAVSMKALAAAIADASSRPFRCKPFFMPGVWGGQRLKQVADLPAEWPNCAWDFEIVAPENSFMIAVGEEQVTVPFHLVLWLRAREVMGELVYRQFGEYFPIRINYLDTMGGTNLSLQVHPHHTYMREHFGEPIGQDESYYVVEQEPGSQVYVGLKEETTQESLREAVRRAEEEAVPFAVTEYVNAWDAKVGDLFLIPGGTVHCSGAQNLVLEISSTPYWYTFKIYDYLRLDLDGKPRPINSAHAFEVIDFTRKTDWVRRHLIPEPLLLRQEAGGAEYHIGSHAFTFYGINRLHLNGLMRDRTDGRFLLLTVVKGEGVRILPPDGDEPVVEIAYLETYVVPAGFGEFRLQAMNGESCQVVKTYVRG